MSDLDLRLVVITDADLAAPRRLVDVVRAAVAAGAPAIQLRDKHATPRALAEQAYALLPIVRQHGARLFINDRLDVAMAVAADGVHLGPDDIPVAAARRVAPPELLIGYSADDTVEARQAERDGASYIGCGAVFGTTTKKEVGDEQIGTRRLDEVARAVTIPVVAIGGITVANIGEISATAASGAAVVGAVMAATAPGEAVAALLRGWRG
jgi:thiamine-phosphate pyrophosphorylase